MQRIEVHSTLPEGGISGTYYSGPKLPLLPSCFIPLHTLASLHTTALSSYFSGLSAIIYSVYLKSPFPASLHLSDFPRCEMVLFPWGLGISSFISEDSFWLQMTEILNFSMLFMVLKINCHMSLFLYVKCLLLDYKLHEEGAISISHPQMPGTVLVQSRYSKTMYY